MENLKFYVDQNAPKTKFDHYWEKCVGACHAYTALREDYRMMLRKAKKDLGFQYVRFHGLFNDQMSVVREVEPGKYEYNFVNIDNIFDFLLSIDMKPFVELSFMPTLRRTTSPVLPFRIYSPDVSTTQRSIHPTVRSVE